MQTKQTHHSSLFLFELMIALLFFILAATICIRLFVKSHTLEMINQERNHAVSNAITVAEMIRSTENPLPFLQKEYPLGSCNNSGYIVYYDSTWTPCSASVGVYFMELQLKIQDDFLLGFIDLYKSDHILYSLTIKKDQDRGILS